MEECLLYIFIVAIAFSNYITMIYKETNAFYTRLLNIA